MVMMNLKTFVLSVTALLSIANVGLVQADNGIIFPPTAGASPFKYPPQVPVAPQFNHGVTQPAPYVFGKNNQPQIAPPQGLIPMPMRGAPYAQKPAYPTRSNGNSFPFSGNNMPFNMNNFGGNGSNPAQTFNPFSNGNMPFSNNSSGMMPSNPMNNMFGNNSNNGNNNNWNMPFFNSNNKRKKAWGDKRNIWPDFYTDFTDETWDTMMSGPRDLGRMPGGWRFPYISMPDPVTVSDAITNQFPPIAEEAGNMADFSDWGVFDN
jgi:hypothetical protein